jgi:hypothetical protein
MKRVAATDGVERRNDKRSAGPWSGGGSANKSKRRQSQHWAGTIRPQRQESTRRAELARRAVKALKCQRNGMVKFRLTPLGCEYDGIIGAIIMGVGAT